MKQIAITPDDISYKSLGERIAELKSKGATHVYLRAPFLFDEYKLIVNQLLKSRIIPIVPYEKFIKFELPDSVCHFRQKNIEEFENEGDFRLFEFIHKNNISFSASCHTFETGKRMLKNGAEFIFVSPVFKPISKPNDNRPCFPLEKINHLVKLGGDKVVLLGGISKEKITLLNKTLFGDFSIAGITMFFN